MPGAANRDLTVPPSQTTKTASSTHQLKTLGTHPGHHAAPQCILRASMHAGIQLASSVDSYCARLWQGERPRRGKKRWSGRVDMSADRQQSILQRECGMSGNRPRRRRHAGNDRISATEAATDDMREGFGLRVFPAAKDFAGRVWWSVPWGPRAWVLRSREDLHAAYMWTRREYHDAGLMQACDESQSASRPIILYSY